MFTIVRVSYISSNNFKIVSCYAIKPTPIIK